MRSRAKVTPPAEGDACYHQEGKSAEELCRITVRWKMIRDMRSMMDLGEKLTLQRLLIKQRYHRAHFVDWRYRLTKDASLLVGHEPCPVVEFPKRRVDRGC